MSNDPGQENFRVYLTTGYVDQGLQRGADQAIKSIDELERHLQRVIATFEKFRDVFNKSGVGPQLPAGQAGLMQYGAWERQQFSNEGQVKAGLPPDVYQARQSLKARADQMEQ